MTEPRVILLSGPVKGSSGTEEKQATIPCSIYYLAVHFPMVKIHL